MSAYVHNADHIDLLVSSVVNLPARRSITLRTVPEGFTPTGNNYAGEPQVTLDASHADELGKLLLRANVQSVLDLYSESVDADEAGEYFALDGYKHRHVSDSMLGAHPTVAKIKAWKSYGYQSCEAKDWEGSVAHDLTERAIDTLVNMLPGYSEADTWEFDRARAQAKVAADRDAARTRIAAAVAR